MRKTLCLLLIFLACEETTKPDTTPPTVTITSPLGGSTVYEIVGITCISTDNEGVEKVELWIDGVTTGLTDGTEPYSFLWNTTDYENSSTHTISVRSYDLSENKTDSDPITLVVDNRLSVPQSVSITQIIFEGGGFQIMWSKSKDDDFMSYALEHSLESLMEVSEVLYQTTVINDTTYFWENASPLSSHYFYVVVTDTFNYSTDSPIVSSSLDPIPPPVNVDLVSYDLDQLIVSWEISTEGDFRDYQLLYSETETGQRNTLATIQDVSITTYSVTSFDPTHENWFWIIVTDTLGQRSIGEGKSNTIDIPPIPVDVISVDYDLTSMTVIWTKSHDDDFIKYEVLYSGSESGAQTVVDSTSSFGDTTYQFTDFSPLHENWFWVRITDHWGQTSTGSGLTHSIDSSPSPVNVTSVNYDTSQMVVSWGQYEPSIMRLRYLGYKGDLKIKGAGETTTRTTRMGQGVQLVPGNDFISYEVLYSTTESGERSSLGTITDITTTAHYITDFDPTHENWFWIKVNDYWGQSSVGTGMTQEIDNPPTQVDVTSVSYDLNDMVTTWEVSSDLDFISYEVLYSETVEGERTSLDIITEIDITSYTISVFDPTNENWFWVKVTDYWGLSSVGNGATNSIDASPTPSLLATVNYSGGLFNISWSENVDSDFASYRLYESHSDIMEDQYLIFETVNPHETSHSLSIAERNIKYYQVVTTDYFGLSSPSNIELGNSFPVPKIGFVIDNGGYIYTIDIEGNNEVNISSGQFTYPYNHPEFFPFGPYVVWKNGAYQLYSVHNDGTNLNNLTPDISAYNPAISPDGQLILFNSHVNGYQQIFVMNIDGTNRTQLTHNTRADYVSEVSPDGSKIVFSSNPNDQWGVYIMNIDGSNEVLLDNTSGFNTIGGYNRFSSDGSKVFYLIGSTIYSINIDGSGKTQLGGGNVNYFELFPDGNRFLMSNDSWIMGMNIDGTDYEVITDDCYCGWGGHPDISQDGLKIVYSKMVDNTINLFIMDVNGDNSTQITSNQSDDLFPSFFEP